ncbi:MAG: hypothetical protein QXH66_05485 [Conexivisphaerales archaeon]
MSADGKELGKLVNGAKGKVNKVFGDSACDSRNNFNAGHRHRACNQDQLHWKIEGLVRQVKGS